MMGFGLVAAHFELTKSHIMQHVSRSSARAVTGTALVAIGAAVNLFSARHYFRLVGEMSSGQFANRSLSRQGVTVALALLGIAMTIYLNLAPGLPPEARHA